MNRILERLRGSFGFLCGCLLFLFSHHLSAEETLSVVYYDQGSRVEVTGERLSPGVYVYNNQGTKDISLSTLNWEPYIGEHICKQGWVMQLTVALLASKDYRIKVAFRPWMRAVMEAETGLSDVLFPEYFIEPDAPSDVYKGTHRRAHLMLSEKIPGGPIALMKRKGEQIEFDGNLQQLIGKRIGVVRGYQNTPEFDALLDKGLIKGLEVTDDLQNARILAGNRVDMIIGDPSVIRFSVSRSSMSGDQKQKILGSIETVQPVLQYNALYYAISTKKTKATIYLNDINDAIASFQRTGELETIIKRTNQACGFTMDTLPVRN